MDKPQLTVKQLIFQLGACFLFGVLMGIIAKFSDTVPANGSVGEFFGYISDVTTNLGIWVALATLIAVWSRSPIYAGLNVLLFFSGMLLAYYSYSQLLFGFSPTHYFLRWGIIALASPLAAYTVWFSRGEGWMAAFCAALPIGLLFAQGYPFFYLFSFVFAIDLLLALLLLAALAKSKAQYLKVVSMSFLVFLIVRNSDILSYIFGGL